MTGEKDHGSAKRRGRHGGFAPETGSFEFTGENANATDRRRTRLTLAAQAFLRRVGSGHE